MMLVLVVLSLLSPSSLLFAQDKPPAQGEPTAEEKAQANNPLADTNFGGLRFGHLTLKRGITMFPWVWVLVRSSR